MWPRALIIKAEIIPPSKDPLPPLPELIPMHHFHAPYLLLIDPIDM